MTVSVGSSSGFKGSTSEFSAPPIRIVTFGDLDGDGIQDVIGHVQAGTFGELAPLHVAYGHPDGSFTANPWVFNGPVPQFITPHVIVADFTGDGRKDLLVYDAGTYDWSIRATVGREPVLYQAGADGRFTATSVLTDAIRPLVQAKGPDYRGGYQVDLTMGIKDVAAADIDGDGDLDLWVESTGSANIASHFMINHGGTFSIDMNNRLPDKVLFGPGFGTTGDYFRYGIGRFVDANADGRPDLVLGQIRDNHFTHINQSSYLVLNNGAGYFGEGSRIALPLPAFYSGYTSVQDVACADINNDGRNDLILVHTRNDDVTGDGIEPPWTGTYVQILTQSAGGQYVDESAQRLGDQSPWSSAALAGGEHATGVRIGDLNEDGYKDFVLSYPSWSRPAESRPIVFLGQADGTFRAQDSAVLTGGDDYFGEGIRAVDINGDGRLDFVHLDSAPGANGTYDGAGTDDISILVAQLATRPMGLALRSTSASEWLTGSAGIDTVFYDGALTDFTITRSETGFTVTGPGEGTDTLTGIERLKFGDAQVALDIEGPAGQAYRLYKAAFDRLPDLGGLGYQMNDLDVGFSLRHVASNFIASPEFQQTYGALSDTDFVTLLYRNVLDREPDAEGLAFHMARLASGEIRAEILMGFSESPENKANVIGVIGNGMQYVW